MAKTTSPTSNPKTSITLDPNPRLPLIILIFGLTLLPLPLHPWPSVLIGLLSILLLIQTFALRLELTPEDLVVWQFGKELRRFPFKDWLAWRLLLPKLPGILYFREVKSPHLLPILFDPHRLEIELKGRVGSLEKPGKQS